jgi:hypothetical protein
MRQLRQWKRELAAQWGRLSALMRFCAGLAVAIAMTYYVINMQVEPLQAERQKVEKELQSAEAPVYVPPPEDDNELQETEISIESITDSLERERRLMAEAIRKANTPATSEEGRVVGAFDNLVFEQGLDILKRERIEPESVAGRLTVSGYAYTLAGSFEQARGFLRAAQSFPHSYRIADMTMRASDAVADETPAGARPMESLARSRGGRTPSLQLDFLLKLHFVEEAAP